MPKVPLQTQAVDRFKQPAQYAASGKEKLDQETFEEELMQVVDGVMAEVDRQYGPDSRQLPDEPEAASELPANVAAAVARDAQGMQDIEEAEEGSQDSLGSESSAEESWVSDDLEDFGEAKWAAAMKDVDMNLGDLMTSMNFEDSVDNISIKAWREKEAARLATLEAKQKRQQQQGLKVPGMYIIGDKDEWLNKMRPDASLRNDVGRPPSKYVPLTVLGPNTLEWQNKTLMDELSIKYWGRPVADRPPRSPLPAFEGDLTFEELQERLKEDQDDFMREAEKYKHDDLAFTNFIRKDYDMPPLVRKPIEDMDKYAELMRMLQRAHDDNDLKEVMDIKREMQGMQLQEDPAWDEEAEDERRYQEDELRDEGMFWETEEEFEQLLKKECDEYIQAQAKLGYFLNEETNKFEVRRVVLHRGEKVHFIPSQLGPGVKLLDDHRTIARTDFLRRSPNLFRPTYAFWEPGEQRNGFSRWRVRVEQCWSILNIGVMEVPFAPTQGLAHSLATRAWFVSSDGEAYRTGPSQHPESDEFIDKENMTVMDPATKVWCEGFKVNPAYRKRGCEMVVDTQTGEVAWLEAERLAAEADEYMADDAMEKFVENVHLQMLLKFTIVGLNITASRWMRVNSLRQAPCADNYWEEESLEDCYARLKEDGTWEQILREFPEPDRTQGKHRFMTEEEMDRNLEAYVREQGERVCKDIGLPTSFLEEQEELWRRERLASLDALKYGDQHFVELQAEGEPAVVTMEFDRVKGTLLFRVDERPETFRFDNVSSSARPFVNIYAYGDSVSLVE